MELWGVMCVENCFKVIYVVCECEIIFKYIGLNFYFVFVSVEFIDVLVIIIKCFFWIKIWCLYLKGEYCKNVIWKS